MVSSKERRPTRRQRDKSSVEVRLVYAIAVIILICIFIAIAYRSNWEWSGFTASLGPGTPEERSYQPDKTLWDWLQLLIIPLVLAGGTVWFTNRQNEAAARVAEDQRAETTLQSFIDHMSDLILHEKLCESSHSAHVRSIARARTLTALRNLDSHRKVVLLRFLYDSRLIDRGKGVVDLRGANFDYVKLDHTLLPGVNLRGAKMRGTLCEGANFTGADLGGADLADSILHGAVFRDANLGGKATSDFDLDTAPSLTVTANGADDLPGANLSRASLTNAVLDDATLDHANMVRTDVTNEQIARAKSSVGIVRDRIVVAH